MAAYLEPSKMQEGYEPPSASLTPPKSEHRTAEAVLIAHQRFDSGSCLCGWSELGKSHPAHQVQMLAEAGHMPEHRTLFAIVEDIKKHGEENPRHGVGCICMDSFARELKNQLREALPDIHSYDPPPSKLTYSTVYSLAHVLNMVTRYL